MESGLSDKVVLVTGASGGIGGALAEAFAAEGARLALLGNASVDALRERVAAEPWADRALVLRADVRRPEELDAAFAQAAERWGRVDVCVANAGRWPSEDVPLCELDPQRALDVVATNLLGATWTARAFLATLARTGAREDGHGASLVFTGSTAGRFGERGHADYALSKAGLVGLVQSLKNEIVALDPYGRVNLVEPGWTVTPMARAALEDPAAVTRVLRTMALRQLGRAKDIARTVCYLASPHLARHVSGQTITVAGGMEGRLLWDADDVDFGNVKARLERD